MQISVKEAFLIVLVNRLWVKVGKDRLRGAAAAEVLGPCQNPEHDHFAGRDFCSQLLLAKHF